LFIFAARMWARFHITRTSGIDDWLIVATMPALLGLTIATVLALRSMGFQLHIYDQTPKTYITIRQITLAMEVIYLGSTTLTKLSILMFYRRITSSVISRPFLIAVWSSIVFVAAYGITFIIVLVFTCDPVEAYWYRFTASWLKTHQYKCTDEVAALLVIITISTFQDFIATMLPMFVVYKLRLPIRQKLALAGVFLIGLAVCATGALRIHYAHRVYYYTKINPSPTYDISWEALGSWVSTAVEANVCVWCASAPALKTYFNTWLNKPGHDMRSFRWYGQISSGWWRPRQPGELPDSACDVLTTPVRQCSGTTTLVHQNQSLQGDFNEIQPTTNSLELCKSKSLSAILGRMDSVLPAGTLREEATASRSR